jgi:hypothetical protein
MTDEAGAAEAWIADHTPVGQASARHTGSADAETSPDSASGEAASVKAAAVPTTATEATDTPAGQSIAVASSAMEAASGKAAVKTAPDSATAKASSREGAARVETTPLEATAHTAAGQSIAADRAAVKAAVGETLGIGRCRHERQRAHHRSRRQKCPVHHALPILNEEHLVGQRGIAPVGAATLCPCAALALSA